PGLVVAWDAHHLADDLKRQRSSEGLHEVASAIRVTLDRFVHKRPCLVADVLLDLSHHPGRKTLLDDTPEPCMPRIVHVDHRAEELADLVREVRDIGALAAAEHIRPAAGLDDVLVAGQRPVARALGESWELSLLEEAHRRRLAQGCEGGLPVVAAG